MNTLASVQNYAMNVDPDIRFMAIKDFQKYLVSSPQISVKNVEKLIPILFHLLNDSNADIQSQTVKTFAPMIVFMSTSKTLEIINKLYDLVEQENEQAKNKKITISIPNMALRSIFSSNIKFSYETSRNVLDSLLPKIIQTASKDGMTFDSIEILTYLIRSIGEVLTLDEIRNLANFLIGIVYNEYGMICKRSIMVLDSLLLNLTEGEDAILNFGNDDEVIELSDETTPSSSSSSKNKLINELVSNIDEHNSKATRSDRDNLSLSLYSILLKNSTPASSQSTASSSSAILNIDLSSSSDYSSLLSNESIAFIFHKINQSLKLKEIEIELDPNDFDYDLLVSESSNREDGLLALNSFVSVLPYDLIVPFWDTIFQSITTFLRYDPLNFGDDEDDNEFADDLDSEIEFSDDEVNEGYNDENVNDCTWKLRKQSAILLRVICNRFGAQLLSSIYSNVIVDGTLLVSINDRNDVVSDEAISTLISILNATLKSKKQKRVVRRSSDFSMVNESDPAILFEEILPRLTTTIFQNLFVEKKIARFPIFLKLVEGIAKSDFSPLPEEFLGDLYNVFKTLNIKTGGNSEYLNLYKVILKTEGDGSKNIPRDFLIHIIQDLTTTIKSENSYHNIIMESLSTSIILFQGFRDQLEVDDVEDIHESVIEKCHNKQYSADLRQKAIYCLTELLYNIKLTDGLVKKSVEVLEESLNYEATVKVALQCLIKVFDKESVNQIEETDDETFELNLLNKLVSFINSLDDSLYHSTLKAITVVSKRVKKAESLNALSGSLVPSLLTFCKIADMKQLLLSFRILTNLIENETSGEGIPIDNDLIQSVVSTVDIKFEKDQQIETEYDINDYENFIKQLCKKANPLELFNEFYNNLNHELFISAITLSIIAIEGKLYDIIEKFEIELQDKKNVLFNIQFLGVISSTLELEKTTLASFSNFFDPSYPDNIKIASAKSIGLFTIRDIGKYLPPLLQEYSEEGQQERELVLVAIKEILLNSEYLSDEVIEQIWEKVWRKQETRVFSNEDNETATTTINTAEAKFVGDILSKICSLKSFYINELISKLNDENELNNSVRYILIVVLKQLLSASSSSGVTSTESYDPVEVDDSSDFLIVEYFLKCLSFFQIMNIPIKQALIGTLLTGLHNKPLMFYPLLQSKILPFVYDELEAKLEFKKTIPMGPYKYNIDEGLEIRKLSYEFLYTILSIDVDLSIYDVKYIDIINNILEKGFKDSENDIIILSSVNISTFINKSPEILNEQDILERLINQIKLVLGKKLKAKPSRQESESYEECQKSILSLSKIINTILTNSSENKNTRKINIRGGQLQKWNSYYINDVKRNFEL